MIESALERDARLLSAFLAQQDAPMQAIEIARGMKIATGRSITLDKVKRALEAMHYAGQIERSRKFCRGRTFLYGWPGSKQRHLERKRSGPRLKEPGNAAPISKGSRGKTKPKRKPKRADAGSY